MKKSALIIFLLLIFTLSAQGQNLTRRASLGFQPVPVDSTMIKDLGLTAPMGLLITSLSEEGTLKSLGAVHNDVLLEINGSTTNTIPELLAVRATMRANDKLTVKVIRNGEEKILRGRAAILPYEESPHAEVIYDQFNFKDGRIRTIIHKPNKPGKHPTIFFIPGYTCSSIDNMHPLNPYRKLLDSMVAKGYAVFKMEKPGMGDNEDTGDCRQLGFVQELESYMVGYDQLKKYDFVDHDNIFLWGHSMGGLYAPLIAAEKQPKGLAFYGMVHDSWTEYLTRMVRYQNPRIGTSDYQQTDQDVRKIFGLLYEHYHLGKSSKELAQQDDDYDRILRRDFWFDGENQILLRHEDFWRELYQYSLTDALVKYNGYVLSMNGEADLEVINDFSQREVVHIVNHYHPGKGEFYYFPRTDHMMIEVGTLEEGAVIRYQPRYRDMMANNFNYAIIDKTHEWIQDKITKSIAVKKKIKINDWYNRLDPSKLTNSSDAYDIVLRDSVAGSMLYHKVIKGNQVVIVDTSTLDNNIWETMEISFDRSTGQMHTGEIRLNYLQHNINMVGQLNWEKDQINGTYTIDRQGVKQEQTIDINNYTNVLGRGAIFRVIPALPIAEDQTYAFNLFAFTSGEVWEMTLAVEEKTNIEWRGRQVETYKMSLSGGAVENTIYMATDGSGKMYQIDVVGQDMQIVLR